METRTLTQLAKKLRSQHRLSKSWRKTSVACQVLTADGRPDPRMAERIAIEHYEPHREETRIRFGLPPKCKSCGHKVRRPLPAWVKEATANLTALELATNAPDRVRVYTRTGHRSRLTNPDKCSKMRL